MKRSELPRKSRHGFTLMEMLIVLAILGMLLALIGPRILRSSKKADVQAAQSQIKLLQGCLKHLYLDMKEYPETEPGLQALVEEPTDAEGTTASRWKGPYTETGELPKDPWGNDYQYRYPPENSKGDLPDIWSYGPDGQDNTEDDIVSWKKEEGGSEEGLDDLESQPDLEPEPEPLPDGA